MKTFLALCLAVSTLGCASLSYNHKDYGNFSYLRFGNSDIGGIMLNIDGKEIMLERAKSDNLKDVMEVLK